MTVSEELLVRARKFQSHAVEQVLLAYYPTVYRMAHALCGRADVAQGIVNRVMSQALKVLPKWTVDGAPERWFYHHTVLASRMNTKQRPDPDADTLLGSDSEPEYRAFVRAVRALPMQQREAFILHHGENFDTRQLGIAMDCSREAAANHLSAALEAMASIAGGKLDDLTVRLAGIYGRLTPPEPMVLASIRSHYRRHVWPRRIWLIARAVIILLFVWVIGYAMWWIWRNIELF